VKQPNNCGATESTVEAIVYPVRERGLAAVKEPSTAERLSRCSTAQRKQIEKRIADLKRRRLIGVGKPPVDVATQKLMAGLAADPEFQRIWQPAVRKFHGAKE
jgi:hypothetical protein